ncbi:hypothetical protein E6P09_17115 (plasmid) [Haloferax mediterranei ATCC 33500]|uniref:Uncharacterized protein n=1 Tax=Haloferax mediterranei (strain ATCC 33500 / DSM 1411 / JCM 8866 / NBRC 14739 / NCIMB 2177 / R-4) TaxID=523841 RepID=I3RAK9_HALMT|nr:hypothetical protein [Haloferax mediterranei]AFK21269.1 hypothetical protein HFX_6145 [Haloferax mediterranei ATCC 33500]AHZ24632.1 hypothetical protein BM92_17205 [Haloferax mediterranei ATCC 33500]ELZ97399.1 hypothetical protein C439_18793 [Haloferax mediterranei ATCC 33500]MDX5990305.1 hypothetical protein [Haloferax mediterranei ATCC 33500]QCQ77028.1 hypothetical protein E6P09_17115 [Haloferax mediterranei ATCC 33500]
MDISTRALKRASIALLVALLMTTAGCSSPAGDDTGETHTNATTVETTGVVTTTSPATADTTDSDTTTYNESTDSGGNESTSNTTTTSNTSNTSNIDAAYTEQMDVTLPGNSIGSKRASAN